jgi:hypothetical protein
MALYKNPDAKAINKLNAESEALLKRAPINAHAQSIILECCERTNTVESLKRAGEVCYKLLTCDAIRKKYWNYRLKSLEEKLKKLDPNVKLEPEQKK